MYKGSNCDRKSQLSEILTEPWNPSAMDMWKNANCCTCQDNLKLSADNISAPQTPQTNPEKHCQSYRLVRRIGNDWPKTVW